MHKETDKPVIILGGGISGLSTAWYLKKAGIPFLLFEKEDQMGGVIQSENHNGTVFDFGPNTIRDRDGEIRKLVHALGIDNQLITASDALKTRFIVRDKKLQRLSSNPLAFMNSDILSTKAKLRLIVELFVPSEDPKDESIGDFLLRRLGRETVDYIIDPIFSGVFAGNIYALSKELLLPKLAEYEQSGGSITWGSIRSKKKKNDIKPAVISFKKGLQQLTSALRNHISSHILQEKITSINHLEDEFVVSTRSDSFIADQVVSTIPAYELAKITTSLNPHLSETLFDITYAPLVSSQLIYNKSDIKNLPKGFGFLIPRKEEMRLLGAIWKTKIFPENTAKDKFHFNLLCGGDLDHAVVTDDLEKTEQEIIHEFSGLMEIESKPTFIKSKVWKNALPQFYVGYQKVKEELKAAEKKYPGFFIGGNFNWGVSVPDCIKGAKECTEKILLGK